LIAAIPHPNGRASFPKMNRRYLFGHRWQNLLAYCRIGMLTNLSILIQPKRTARSSLEADYEWRGTLPLWNGDFMEALKIGTTIRGVRLQKGMSQGDIEKRTGLLRCYLSRVENGHTVPSLDTLYKIAGALDVPLAHFFAENALSYEMPAQRFSDDELRFLTQIRRYAANLNESDRRLLLAMVKKFAGAENN
jgi:transcriptional regulator with XRE-family HTH domain